MSKDQLVQRLIASEAGVDSNRLRAGRISPNEWDSVYKAVDRISELPIYIDDNASMMVMEMRSQARKLQAEHGGKLGLIMIDYLQLMEGGGDNRVQEISKHSKFERIGPRIASTINCTLTVKSKRRSEK
jgi:replicative DNA helicase